MISLFQQFSSIIREVLPPVKRNEGAEVLFKGNTLQVCFIQPIKTFISGCCRELFLRLMLYARDLSLGTFSGFYFFFR